MSPREKLQIAYELAFYPPRLHRLWSDLKKGNRDDRDHVIELLEMALSLHQMLPERGFASFRALKRLAIYQANARLFGMVTFLRNILAYLSVDSFHPKRCRESGFGTLVFPNLDDQENVIDRING